MNLTLEELSYYDGREGRRAFAAVDGVIYDLTDSLLWVEGTHRRFLAGRDLTEEFYRCHPGFFVLSRFPVVGYLVE
ncbi:putative heme/steroid binding protein [Natranaerovirga hydrolytica]|uniref:Putative heme/steroid binding protein n=2 Tax=Natranaerovirga hydrolytica TaxID=680378 RepID=A0A4R1MY31_9FIRM|nr:putative heme/steroid binding protein [Natranaerovirga hydrolytica]